MVLVIQEYELYLCDQILYELNDVVKRKAPNALSALSILIDDLDFINVPEVDLGSVSISDTNKMIIFVFRWKLTLPTFTNALNGFVQGWLGTRDLTTTDKGEMKMDSYEQYEQDCARIRKENEKTLGEFEKWLSDKKLSPKTVANHRDNVDFYINEFLLYEEAQEASEGIDNINYYLGFWFIKKATWASKSSIKHNATSIKKFYEFMHEKGIVDAYAYYELKEEIKENMQDWLDTMDRYDDPAIEDMEEVWGL